MTDRTPPPVILGRYAGIFSRGAAYAIDRAIIMGITFLIMTVINSFLDLINLSEWLGSQGDLVALRAVLAILLSTVGITIIVSLFYDVGYWLLSGQTPGKRILGLRVMSVDGGRLNFNNALMRSLGYWVSAIFFIGYLWILVDNRRQGFHDKLGKTIVTYAWPEGRQKATFVIERVQRFKDRRD